MRSYNRQHRFYSGVDLHARTLSRCVLDAAGAAVGNMLQEEARRLAGLE